MSCTRTAEVPAGARHPCCRCSIVVIDSHYRIPAAATITIIPRPGGEFMTYPDCSGTSSAKVVKKSLAIFFAVPPTSREPICASLPPTCNSAL